MNTKVKKAKDKEIADKWLSEDLENREIFNIDAAIDFSTQFFKPLVDKKELYSD